jgi:hypothetical protein
MRREQECIDSEGIEAGDDRRAARAGNGAGRLPEPSPAIRLDPESVERVAARVAEILRVGPANPRRPIDAAEVALRLGRSRGWVYEHATELGASRPLKGRRSRLLFDPARIDALVQGGAADPHVRGGDGTGGPAFERSSATARRGRPSADPGRPADPLEGSGPEGGLNGRIR